jgi:flagellar biosynthesis repressor protein FlbT
MLIHLKRNEKLFINGAVLRLEKRATIELLNDAQFLLENHIMQPNAATTPLRQLYFVVQTMIMDPENARLTLMLFDTQVSQLEKLASTESYLAVIQSIKKLVARQDYYESLKLMRKNFVLEDALLAGKQNPSNEKAQAA